MKKHIFIFLLLIVPISLFSQATPDINTAYINDVSIGVENYETYTVEMASLSEVIIKLRVDADNSPVTASGTESGAWVTITLDQFINDSDKSRYEAGSFDSELKYTQYYGQVGESHPDSWLNSCVAEFELKQGEKWSTTGNKNMEVKFTPKSYGLFVIYYRAAMKEDGEIIRDPSSSGYRDAFGYRANKINLWIVQSGKPDLEIDNMWTDPSNPRVGENVDLYVRIKNDGNAVAEDIKLTYYIDNNIVGDGTHSSLDPGYTKEENEQNYKFSTTGEHKYKVIIDPVDGETNTENNTGEITVYVQDVEQPDFDIIASSVSPSTVEIINGDPQSKIDWSCTVKNIGETRASIAKLGVYMSTSSSDLGKWVDDKKITNQLGLSGLNNGDTDPDNGSFNIPSEVIPSTAGTHTRYIHFYADYEDAEKNEEYETNNKDYKPITLNIIAEQPDFDIIASSVNQSTINVINGTPESKIDWSCSVKNIGETRASIAKLGVYMSTSSSDLGKWVDDKKITNQLGLSGLNNGDTDADDGSFNIPSELIPTTVGNHTRYIHFYADYEDAEKNEKLETNNRDVKTITLNIIAERIELAQWQNINGQDIENTQIQSGTTVKLQISVDDYESGTQFDLIIKEQDIFRNDSVTTVTVAIDANGNATGSWQSEYFYKEEKSTKSEDLKDLDKLPDFYFEVHKANETNKIGKSGKIEVIPPETLIIEQDSTLSLGSRQPLLLVHGWQTFGIPANYKVSIWDNFKTFFYSKPELKDKYKIYFVKYLSNYVSIKELGSLFREKIDQLEINNFTILAHSMGGLVSRAFMNYPKDNVMGGEMVDLLITLGTPHHGSPMSNGAVKFKEFPLFENIINALETIYFIYKNGPTSSQQNRIDMRWNNFDNLFSQLSYFLSNESPNKWLLELNSNTDYDNKIIAYAGNWLGKTHASDEQPGYALSWSLMNMMGTTQKTNTNTLTNDAIVPLSSAHFHNHTLKDKRLLEDYNHTRIAKGNEEAQNKTDSLFAKYLYKDLMGISISELIFFPSESLDFENTQINEQTFKTLVIHHSGSEDITISNLSIGGPNANQFDIVSPTNLSFIIPPGSIGKEIVVRFSPDSEGSKVATLSINNDSENEGPVKEITLNGSSSTETKILTVNPSYSWDYGNVKQNVPTDKIFTFQNTGTSTLTVTELSLSGDNLNLFSIVSPTDNSFLIPPNESQEVIVRFTPDSEGAKLASLNITNDSDNEGSVKNIFLTGAGIQVVGSLNVTILPSEVVDAGAQWSIDNGLSWRSSSTPWNNLAVGDYTITFRNINGWITPQPMSVIISPDQPTTAEGTYIKEENPSTCNITITYPDQNTIWETAEEESTEYYSVYWEDDISEDVKIEIYKGSNWLDNISNSTESNGYYVEYVMPNTFIAGKDYRVKIINTSNSSCYSWSKAFEVTNPFQCAISITSPNSNNSWQAGTSHSIIWSDNFNDNVKIDLYKNGDFYRPIINTTASVGNYDWTIPSDLSSGTDYRIKITNISNNDCYGYSDEFKTTTLPPDSPIADDATNITQTSFTANWNSSATANGYRLDVATNIGFTSFVSGYEDVDVNSVTSVSIIGLYAGTPYYYRVRTYNNGGTSPSSNEINVRTFTYPSSIPTNLSTKSCNDLVTLTWDRSEGDDFDRYIIYGDISINPIIRIDSTSSDITNTSIVIDNLENGQTYHFRVRAVNYDDVESDFSNQSTVTVKTGVIPKITAKWGNILICLNVGDSIVSYQWYNNDINIPNAVDQHYVTDRIVGVYKVEIVDINGCVSSSESISISETKALTVFPNPTDESFILKIDNVSEGNAIISLTNLLGVEVMGFQTGITNDLFLKEISVSNLAEGVYIVQVLLNHNKLYYKKIVIKR